MTEITDLITARIKELRKQMREAKSGGSFGSAMMVMLIEAKIHELKLLQKAIV